MDEMPSCSSNSTDAKSNLQNNELSELSLEQGINVWGADQQALEQQASKEIDIFTQRNSVTVNNHNLALEDGEIAEIKGTETLQALDINSYIQRQEQLKKIQQYQRTLQVNNKSKIIADKIALQQKVKGVKRKRKSSESGSVKKVKTETVVVTTDKNESGSEYVPSEGELADDPDYHEDNVNFDQTVVKKKRSSNSYVYNIDKVRDDGCLEYFKNRLENFYKELENEKALEDEDPDELEYYTIKGGLKIPFRIWNNLYSYQHDGVRWMWQLHQKTTGGLLGDEMGLGKTVQVIAFLAGLQYSQVSSSCYKGVGPTLIVCPATVIYQWVKHFHDWYPEFRVSILHQSGSYPGNKNKLIKEMNESRGIIVTTYSSILKYKETLLEYNWHYLILDEGHKIRNPNAKVSVAVKQIRTPHRLMLTGSPMQNNLQELWSLFDFTNPDMLGSLTTFMEHFNNPIVQGGFENATPMQEATALQVATTLKNIITPYLLRRSKLEVQDDISLPNKSEQVLFCSLTDEQRDLYKGYLMGDQIGSVLGKDSKNWFSDNQVRSNVLVAITTLRKICNHPDIYFKEDDGLEVNEEEIPPEQKFGYYKKSGKMIVVSALLKMWKKQKHRVLLFTQSRAMILVFEEFLKQQGYKYLKMDGRTAVSSRQPLINKFNEDSCYDVFLLTTRVGGLGVNLTGANRVIIYDPDWNPATDTQARERAWRIGQDKQVTIYRLLSAGTIEEKMYQRQVWKQLLSNKVLIDPRTHRFFKSSGLHDLFSLSESQHDSNPETANIFRDSRVKLEETIKEKKAKRKDKVDDVRFSEEKIQAMKNLAQQISKSIANPKPEVPKTSYQVELEEERRKKLSEKEELKKLSAAEIMFLNREKSKPRIEIVANRVDDCETSVSFSKALEYSEQTSKLYHELKEEKITSSQKESEVDKDSSNNNKKAKKKKKDKHKEIFKSVIDETGTIEGEKVDGLVKTEIKKLRKKHEQHNNSKNETQDQYVLEKLFMKKGVSSALQHDSIVESSVKTQSLKVQNEAKLKADKSLEALKKSRLDNWRW